MNIFPESFADRDRMNNYIMNANTFSSLWRASRDAAMPSTFLAKNTMKNQRTTEDAVSARNARVSPPRARLHPWMCF